MSDLTALIAIPSLALALGYVLWFWGKAANDLSTEIVTGVVRGTPVSVGVREGMLYGMWLPAQFAIVILTVLVALAMLEMANHVSDANVKLLARLAAFTAGGNAIFVLTVGLNALLRYRAKLRRDKQRQAEAG